MFLNTSSFKIRLCRISLPWIMLYLFKTIQCTSTANTSVVLYRRQRLRIQFHTPIEFSNSTDKCCIIPFFSVLLIQSYFTKCLLLIFYQARMERLFFLVPVCKSDEMWTSYVMIQGLAGERKQTWTAARTELVPDLLAVVAAVEGLRQICECKKET